MNYILKNVLCIFILLIFQCCKTNNSNLIKLSELDIMKMISDHNFDLSKAVFIGFTNEILSEEKQKFFTKTYLGKDFYVNNDFEIKEVRFRNSVTYNDRLIDLSIKFSSVKPVNTLPIKTIDCKSLKTTLEEIFDKDQESRITGMDIKIIDSVNRIKAIHIIEKCGIPKKQNVGLKALLGVYVAVQHAPREILAHYYPLFYLAAQQGDIPLATLATMQDRLLVQNGYDQVYGTQRASIGDYPIQNPENVNERREKVGLSPL